MLLYLHLSERDPLWRREMRERWRRPTTLFFVTLYVASLCWFAYSLYGALVPVGSVELGPEVRGIGHRLFVSLLRIQILMWIPFACFLGAPTIAAERERRSLTEYLLAGLQSDQIVRAKFASIATFMTVMCAVPVPVLALCFPLGGVEPLELVAGFLLEITVATACAAMGLLVSTNKTRVSDAMQGAVLLALVFLVAGIAIVPGLLELPFWIWMGVAGFLALGTLGLIRGCESTLDLISQKLEQEEPGGQVVSFSFAPNPTPDVPQESAPILPAPDSRVQEEVGVEEALPWDGWIEKVAAYNALAHREVRVGMRAWRRKTEFAPYPPTYHFSPGTWAFIGFCCVALLTNSYIGAWWIFGLLVVTLLALVAAATSSSAAFTRERQQKMFAQLKVCPLSPLEIVGGKMGGMALLVARSWGAPLLALFALGLVKGLSIALLSAAIVVLTLLLAIALATFFSLLCRHTSIATGGTFIGLATLFVLLPFMPSALLYLLPWLRVVLTSFPLGPMWLEPISVLLNTPHSLFASSPSQDQALVRVASSLATLDTFLVVATMRVWTRTSSDGEQVKRRFWERDMSHSWR